jgi:hypothetical protein
MNIKEQARRIFERSDPYAWGRDKKYTNRKKDVLSGRPWVKVLTPEIVEESLKNGRNLFVTNKDGLDEAFITIDIDPDLDGFSEYTCQHACRMMAKSLCETYPGSVEEPSTNGVGRHVRLRLKTEGWDATKIQERLRHLEAHLDMIKFLHQPGIKQVEVKQTVSSHRPGEKWGFLCRVPGVLPDLRGKAQLTVSRIQEVKELPAKRSGSGFEKLFALPKWDYKKAQADYKDASYYLMTYRKEVTGRRRVYALDFQIALIALSVIAQNANEDKQLPTELVKYVWGKVASKLGVEGVERAFDYNRWACIRNTLSDCQFINWTDNRYWFSEQEDEVGKAMQWELRPEFVYNPSMAASNDMDKKEKCVLGNNLLRPLPDDYVGLRPLLYLRGRINAYDLAEGERLVEEMFS